LPPQLAGAANDLATNLPPDGDLFQHLGPGVGHLPLEATAHAGWRSSVRSDSQLFSSLLNVLAYGSLAGLVHAVYFYRRARERERRAVVLESNLAKARLHTLQAQLQPHFLFNALNAVSTLLHRDARAAQDALTSFSELLRLALNQSEKQEVFLREDLLFLERYVEIQRTRLGDRFAFEQTVEPSTLNCLVPTLFLQPLVENSIRHGIELSSNPGLVRIAIRPNGERLLLTVEDNGVGLAAAEQQRKTGTGLANLRARLEALYGRDQKLEVVSRPEGGVAVRLEIPLRHASADNHEPQHENEDPRNYR
jgi:LytS/YehU family sensor histidine kinase